MSKYSNLPYLSNEDFPFCEYGKAAACRAPIRDAINAARAMPESKMEQLITVLEQALAHIRPGESNEEITADTSDDPLDELLGPAES